MEENQQTSSRKAERLDKIILALLVFFLACSAFSIALSEIGYFSALVFWLGRMVYLRKFSYPRSPLDLFILGYVLAEILATIFAYDKLYSLLYLQRRLLLLPVMYIIVANTTSSKELKLLFGALMFSAVVVSLWSMRDLVLHFNEYLHFQRRLSEFQIYMTAGGLMMIALLLLLPFLVHKETPKKLRWLCFIIIIPLGINLFFTFTRSSWLGFLVGSIVIGTFRSKKIFLALTGIILVILLIASPEVNNRIYSIFDPNHPMNVTRVHMWKTGWKIFLDHPLVGIGDIGTETVWDQYADPGWVKEGHLHNNIIMWMVTLGVVGTIALIALFVKIGMFLYSIVKKYGDDWLTSSLALGGLAVIVGFQVNGLFEWNFGDTEIITVVWAIVGLNIAASKIVQQNQTP